MIVPDANLLIYAYDDTSPMHIKARQWWERVLSGTEPVGIPWVVILAFVRLMTHPTLSANPMTVSDAGKRVEDWFKCPHVRMLAPTLNTLKRFLALLESVGMVGNLSTDALIAATAEKHGGMVYFNDADFDRLPGIIRRNPLAF